MQIYPAIDLMNGSCVRLLKGNFSDPTVYSNEPLKICKQFENEGAQWLHVVDLDAARNPATNQFNTIKNIIQNTSLKIQMGGGIRTDTQLSELFSIGVERVIIGSQAVLNSKEVEQWLDTYGSDNFTLAVDARNINNEFYVAYDGWQSISQIKLEIFVDKYLDKGIKHVLCTDISCDGTLQGPNFDLYKKLLNKFPQVQWQASGGIANLLHLKQLQSLKISGAVIGTALYQNKFSLSEALKC